MSEEDEISWFCLRVLKVRMVPCSCELNSVLCRGHIWWENLYKVWKQRFGTKNCHSWGISQIGQKVALLLYSHHTVQPAQWRKKRCKTQTSSYKERKKDVSNPLTTKVQFCVLIPLTHDAIKASKNIKMFKVCPDPNRFCIMLAHSTGATKAVEITQIMI